MAALIIIILLHIFNLGYYLAKHGERKDGEYNFWVMLLSTFITFALFFWMFKDFGIIE